MEDEVSVDADRQRVGVVVVLAVVRDRRTNGEAQADDGVVFDGDDANLRNNRNTSPW